MEIERIRPLSMFAHFMATVCYLLEQLDTGLQIQAEVDEDPVDALLLVLFLLQHKHVVVEELLQLLVGEIDA